MPKSDLLLVTGGSRGIGAAIVRAAARRGWSVCFSYRSDEAAARAVCEELGETVAGFQGDVADEAFAQAFLAAANERFGRPKALVNNAGITGRIGAFTELDDTALRRTMEVNVIGTMLLTQALVRTWRENNLPGRVVNVSSIAATLGAPGEYVHYAASKAAIDAFTVGLGKELAPYGIRVNAVAPGTTDTDIHAAGGAPDRARLVAPRVPMQRVAQPSEIADAVIWLLSEDAAYVTGTVLRVAGGL